MRRVDERTLDDGDVRPGDDIEDPETHTSLDIGFDVADDAVTAPFDHRRVGHPKLGVREQGVSQQRALPAGVVLAEDVHEQRGSLTLVARVIEMSHHGEGFE